MPIKYNPYNWKITKKLTYPTERDIQQIRKDLVEELHDAVNQPYIIEQDIDLLITKLHNFQFLFDSSE